MLGLAATLLVGTAVAAISWGGILLLISPLLIGYQVSFRDIRDILRKNNKISVEQYSRSPNEEKYSNRISMQSVSILIGYERSDSAKTLVQNTGSIAIITLGTST